MNLSIFTFQIILVFLPGIIATETIQFLTDRRKDDHYKFRYIISSILFGIISYIFVECNNYIRYILTSLNLCEFISYKSIDFFNMSNSSSLIVNLNEIFLAIFFALIISIIFSVLINKKVLIKLARKLNITHKFDEDDVWSYVFNSEERYWIIIRDIKNDLLYQGWLSAFSTTHNENEILLSNVQVYRNSNTEEVLYNMEKVYCTK